MLRTIVLALLCALTFTPPALAAVAAESAPEPEPELAFPVVGKVSYGGFANRFGGGRGHDGHDVFADCGTPLVAAAPGEVMDAKYHGSAGNYVVIRTESGRDHFYAHLRLPAAVEVGEKVDAGERLGSVGDSGNAWDCHLHFEIWTAPGWYRGGRAIDPLPFLRSLP
jgi:murein DD-endopeptidase MepM/ murein hydrolase activator NlpD